MGSVGVVGYGEGDHHGGEDDRGEYDAVGQEAEDRFTALPFFALDSIDALLEAVDPCVFPGRHAALSLADKTLHSQSGCACAQLGRSRPTRRASHWAPTVSVRPWATIEQTIAIAAMSKIRLPSATSDLSTKRAKSIEATPLGPNQAMKSFCGRGMPVLTKEIITASGLATIRTKTTKRISGGMLWWKPVATIRAPKTKKVSTWRIALVFSANSTKPSGTSLSLAAIAMPQTKAAISPFPIVTSARPKA